MDDPAPDAAAVAPPESTRTDTTEQAETGHPLADNPETSDLISFAGSSNSGVQVARNYGVMINTVTSEDKLRDLSEGIQGLITSASAQAVSDDLQGKKARLLASLRFTEIHHRQSKIDESYPETFGWIFNEKDSDRAASFTNWLREGQKVYWIRGKAGSGKSTLMKFIAGHSRTSENLALWAQGKEKLTIVTFYFWLSGSEMQRSFKGLLCSLIRQLLLVDELALVQVLSSNQFEQKETTDDWGVSDLKVLLNKVIALVNQRRKICVLIDGADEFDHKTTSHPTDEILDFIMQLTTSRNVKACISSRPERLLERQLSKFPSLQLEDMTRPDIQKVITERIKAAVEESSEDTSEETNEDNIQLLVQIMIEKAQGVFLWVHLALNDVIKGVNEENQFHLLLARLQRLPSGMESLYKEMLDRSDVLYQKEARLFFSLYQFFPASVFHMTIATQTDIQLKFMNSNWSQPSATVLKACKKIERTISSRCAGLLEVRHAPTWPFPGGDHSLEHYRTAKVDFIHQTAREFLLETRIGREWMGGPPSLKTQETLWLNWARCHLTELIQFGRLENAEYPDYIGQVLEIVARCDPSSQVGLAEKLRQVCLALGAEDEQCTSECVTMAASKGCFQFVRHFIERNLPKLGHYYMGYLISNIVSTMARGWRNERQGLDLMRWLIELGADVGTKNFCQGKWEAPVQQMLKLAIKKWDPMDPVYRYDMAPIRKTSSEALVNLVGKMSLNESDWNDLALMVCPGPRLKDIGTFVSSDLELRSQLPEGILEGELWTQLWIAISSRNLFHLAAGRLKLHGLFAPSNTSIPYNPEDPIYVVRYLVRSSPLASFIHPKNEAQGALNFDDAIKLGEAFKDVCLDSNSSEEDLTARSSNFAAQFAVAMLESKVIYGPRNPMIGVISRLGMGTYDHIKHLLYSANSNRDDWWKTGWFEFSQRESPPKDPVAVLIDSLPSKPLPGP